MGTGRGGRGGKKGRGVMADFWVVDDGLLYHGPGGVARTALFSRCVQALRLLDALETMADATGQIRKIRTALHGRDKIVERLRGRTERRCGGDRG